MPTYKNIRVPKRGGGSRLQRVQVLASGKYKFVKNLTKSAKKGPKKKKSKGKGSGSKGRRNVSRGKMFGNISGIGALEDLGVGLVGGVFFRAVLGQRENAIPATRILQGLAGHAMNRRGKRHLVDGLIDYIDNLLLNMIGMPVAGAGAQRLKLPSLFQNL